MKEKILVLTIVCASLAAGVVGLTCQKREDGHRPGRWRLPEIKPGETPDPVHDFIRLRKLFKKHGGDLVTRDDKAVNWKDTEMFRLFEFKNHSVVVFPYNWNERVFQVIVFAGHVKSYENLFDPIFYEYGEKGYTNETMDLDPSAANIGDVSFNTFRLGEPRDDLIRRQVQYIRSVLSPNDAQQQNIWIGTLTGHENASSTERAGLRSWLAFEDGKLCYMDLCPREGFSSLGGWSITHPKLTVLESGQFEIPKEN